MDTKEKIFEEARQKVIERAYPIIQKARTEIIQNLKIKVSWLTAALEYCLGMGGDLTITERLRIRQMLQALDETTAPATPLIDIRILRTTYLSWRKGNLPLGEFEGAMEMFFESLGLRIGREELSD